MTKNFTGENMDKRPQINGKAVFPHYHPEGTVSPNVGIQPPMYQKNIYEDKKKA